MNRYRLFLISLIAILVIIAANVGGVHDAVKGVIEFYQNSGYFRGEVHGGD